MSSSFSQIGNTRLRELEQLAGGYTARLEPPQPAVLRFKKLRVSGLTRVAEGDHNKEMASPWHLGASSWQAAAKATLSFLPGCLPGLLGMGAS